jgi:hypothetical protein
MMMYFFFKKLNVTLNERLNKIIENCIIDHDKRSTINEHAKKYRQDSREQ